MYNPQREQEILAFWQKEQIFKKSLEQTKNGEPFVFYDGPPFATGLPHFGHGLPTTLKDIIPRYQTMRGRFVPRTWGWDCHGLPIENLVEKKLGLKNKKDIEEYGIEKFNKEARDSVLLFSDEWKKIISRLGRWVDMDNDYRTMNASYTESVWWSFQQLNNKKLVYEGFKSMQICPRCETTLSNFEVGQGYKDITDLSVYAKFELVNEPGTFVLAWTTTPWTLPGNVALAINANVDYVKIKKDEAFFILAKERLTALEKHIGKDPGEYEIISEMKGSELVGGSYKPLFDYYSTQPDLKNKENGWKMYAADFVTTTDGTGVVHIAPAFGEDDLNLGMKEHLPFVQHVTNDGKFKAEVTDFAGELVKPKGSVEEKDGHQKADIEIIKYLAKHGTLFAKDKFIHSYPHCWRCETPLLNYATSSWFVKVTDLKDRMVKENEGVKWNPEHVGAGRFGKWLENARDWAISRSRYWGAPLPIWQSIDKKETEIIGSIDELKKKIKRNTYFALRHGEAEHNVLNVMSSLVTSVDHLTEKGKAHIHDIAKEVAKNNIDVVFVSPLMRTKETLEIFVKETGFSGEVVVDDRLEEVHCGDFEGKAHQDYVDFFTPYQKTSERYNIAIPGGESIFDLRKRVGEFMYDVDAKYEGKNILIVTHEGIVRMLSALGEGGDNKALSNAWGDFGPFVQTGTCTEIHFAALPHNEHFELDLHRPYIDAVEWISEIGNNMKRIPDVFDTWYDSGSMPFASKHYPFESAGNKSDLAFPADFIAEGIDQTRGWFYSLLVLGVGLFDKSPYKNVVVNGMVLAEDGRKMSKSLNNYPPLLDTVEKYGADSLRYFLASSPVVKGEDISFSEKNLDEIVKKHFNRLYNVISLYDMYKDKMQDAHSHLKSTHVLDVWIKALLAQTIETITTHLDNYEFDKATKPIGDFIEELSTWYIRRSRDRFKSEFPVDRDQALGTTRHVLIEFAKVMAPFVPFLAEDVYLNVFENKPPHQSVHLEAWPHLKITEEEKATITAMIEVRKLVTLGLELRMRAGIKVRQPLSRLKIRDDVADLSEDEGYLSLIKDEVNVKEVIFDAEMLEEIVLDTDVTDELRKEGIARELMRSIQELRKAALLSPGDKIDVKISGRVEVNHIANEYRDMITRVTSVQNFLFEEKDNEEFEVEIIRR